MRTLRAIETLEHSGTPESCEVLEMLARLAKDEAAKYQAFWSEFGTVFKEGLAEDHGNRDKIMPLLRFASTHDAGVSIRNVACTSMIRMLATQVAMASPR